MNADTVLSARSIRFPIIGMLSKWVGVLEGFMLVTGTLLSILIAVIAVVFRYLLDRALAWPEEVTGFILILVTIVGASVAILEDLHPRVALFASRMSKRALWRLEVFVSILTTVVMLIILVLSFQFINSVCYTEQSCISLESIPLWIPMVSLPVGVVLIVFRCFERLLRLIGEKEAQ